MAKIGFKMPRHCPKMAEAPKWPRVLQDGPKMAQSGPKMAQDGPKMATRGAQAAQRGAKNVDCLKVFVYFRT